MANFLQGENDVLTLVMQSRLKVGDQLATHSANDEVTGVRVRDGKVIQLRAKTRVRVADLFGVLWIEVEVLTGRHAGKRVRLRPSDLKLLRVRST
jgi:hypothetical protein